MAITEQLIEAEQIEVIADGSLQVRDTTVVLRDGVRDLAFPPRYHRNVLHQGDDLSGKPERVTAIADAIWTEEVIAAWAAAQSEVGSAE